MWVWEYGFVTGGNPGRFNLSRTKESENVLLGGPDLKLCSEQLAGAPSTNTSSPNLRLQEFLTSPRSKLQAIRRGYPCGERLSRGQRPTPRPHFWRSGFRAPGLGGRVLRFRRRLLMATKPGGVSRSTGALSFPSPRVPVSPGTPKFCGFPRVILFFFFYKGFRFFPRVRVLRPFQSLTQNQNRLGRAIARDLVPTISRHTERSQQLRSCAKLLLLRTAEFGAPSHCFKPRQFE